MQKARGNITQRRDGAWFLYLPKTIAGDSGFPFETGEKVVITFDDEKLVAHKVPKTRKCPKCLGEAHLEKVNFDGTARYICDKCGGGETVDV